MQIAKTFGNSTLKTDGILELKLCATKNAFHASGCYCIRRGRTSYHLICCIEGEQRRTRDNIISGRTDAHTERRHTCQRAQR